MAKRPGAEGPAIPQIKESDLSDENHPAYVAPVTVQHDSTSPVELEAAPMGVVYPAARWPGALAPAATAPVQQQRKAAIDFKKNQAIKFVNKIKTRFAKDSDVYKQFLEILQVPARPQDPAPRSSVLGVACCSGRILAERMLRRELHPCIRACRCGGTSPFRVC